MAKELLNLIEQLDQSRANTRDAFNQKDDGVSLNRAAAKLRENKVDHMNRLTEAQNLITAVNKGRKPFYYLKEAMTTSDFPILFGEIIDRQLLAGYVEFPTSYSKFCKIGTVPDFRLVDRYTMDGGEGVLDIVGEKENYPQASLTEGQYQYSVKKYGRKFDFSFEAMINDDLGAFDSAPNRLARAARRTEEKFATNLFVGTTGPDTTFFAAGNNNVVTSNPVLSIAALQTAMSILAAQVDEDGEPIVVLSSVLAVPPALEIVAKNILNAIHIEVLATGGGDSNQGLRAVNWMKNSVELVVLPYHPIIASSSGGDISWYLFANPSDSRPAMEVGFLRGYAEPQVFMKSSNQVAVGGGLTDAMGGDFETDDIEYKVRHILGGTLMDPKAAVASSGAGS